MLARAPNGDATRSETAAKTQPLIVGQAKPHVARAFPMASPSGLVVQRKIRPDTPAGTIIVKNDVTYKVKGPTTHSDGCWFLAIEPSQGGDEILLTDRALSQYDLPSASTFTIIDPESEETPDQISNTFETGAGNVTAWKLQVREWELYQSYLTKKEDYDRLASQGKAPVLAPKWRGPVPKQPGKKAPATPPSPWLAIKDLYAAVTVTGETSWEGLVRDRLNAEGPDHATNFTVFTGMHGNTGGQFLEGDTGRIKDAYKDAKHTTEDTKTALRLMGELPGCDIRVIDVFAAQNAELREPAKLRDAAKAQIAQGRVVMLAWCYSMDGFKAAPKESDDNKGPKEIDYVTKRKQEKMKTIVNDVFGDLDAYVRPAS